MKKIFLLLAAVALTNHWVSAQHESLTGFIEKYKQEDAFMFAYLSKDLFEVVAQTNVEDKDWKKLHNVVKNIGSLSILAADSIETGLSLYKEALRHIPAGEFDELLTVQDGKDRVRIWSKDEGDIITDLILLVGTSDEFVLVCFAGALELGNIAELAELFDAGEAEHLVQAAEAVAVDFSISPNPGNGAFTLSCTDGQDVPALLSVADQNGRQITTLRLSDAGTQPVNLQDLPAGLYWLQLKTQKGNIGVKQVQIVKN